MKYKRATIRLIYGYHIIKLCSLVIKKFQRKRISVLIQKRAVSVD